MKIEDAGTLGNFLDQSVASLEQAFIHMAAAYAILDQLLYVREYDSKKMSKLLAKTAFNQLGNRR